MLTLEPNTEMWIILLWILILQDIKVHFLVRNVISLFIHKQELLI